MTDLIDPKTGRPNYLIYKRNKGAAGICPKCGRSVIIPPSEKIEKLKPYLTTLPACGHTIKIIYQENK